MPLADSDAGLYWIPHPASAGAIFQPRFNTKHGCTSPFLNKALTIAKQAPPTACPGLLLLDRSSSMTSCGTWRLSCSTLSLGAQEPCSSCDWPSVGRAPHPPQSMIGPSLPAGSSRSTAAAARTRHRPAPPRSGLPGTAAVCCPAAGTRRLSLWPVTQHVQGIVGVRGEGTTETRFAVAGHWRATPCRGT